MNDLPTYDELARAFWEYVAHSNNDGHPVTPSDGALGRAIEILDRTGVDSPYAGYPA